MFRFLIDTCVWIDIAKDPELQPLLNVMEELIDMQEMSIILPRIVIDEFESNKDKLVVESCRSLSSIFKRVEEAVNKFGDPTEKAGVLKQLNEVDRRIPLLGQSTVEAIDKIKHLMDRATVIEVNDATKLRAAQRAIEKKAPFHHGRNEVNDAIILEIYADCVHDKNSKGVRFAFVTHNKNDFSEPNGDKRLPHADIAQLFSRVKSLYFISLKDALRKMKPSLLINSMAEEDWSPEPRTFSEITNAVDDFFDKVWYGRHGLLADAVKSGKTQVVAKKDYPEGKYCPSLIRKDIWNGAQKAASKVEKKYGIKNLGPWDDFEWGMLSGKLSALRWVLGDEWDILDT
jgi:hypothetical protein